MLSVTSDIASPFNGISKNSLTNKIKNEITPLQSENINTKKPQEDTITISDNAMKLAENSEVNSGYRIMLSRLFNDLDPPMINGSDGMSINNISRKSFDFLTREDCIIVSEMYAYAKEQGADLTYVDRWAAMLGDYRQHDDGRLTENFNSGANFDDQGHQLTISFNAEDTATAERILNGNSINNTRLDKCFLKHILDPGYSAMSINNVNLKFLEKMVVKFSNEDVSQPILESDFTIHTEKNPRESKVLHASSDVILSRPETEIMRINNTWIITEKGQASGITMEDLL